MKNVSLSCAVLLFCLMSAMPGTTLAEAPAQGRQGSIPFKQEKQSTGDLAYQSFAGLVLAGLAAYGITLGLKRYGGRTGGILRKTRRVHIVEVTRLGRHSMLYVVEYKGRELLLAEGEHGIQILTNRPAESGDQENGDV